MVNAFSEKLAPLRVRTERQRTSVRPISRVWFELSDKAAFEECIQLSLKWMGPRALVKFSSEAWNGASFDVTDVLGANSAKAIRVDATDGAIWVARLDFADLNFPRTWVSEFFSERRRGELSRFGAQLTCVERADTPSYDITRPTLVRHVLKSLSAEADGWPLSNSAYKIDVAEVASFEELIYNPARRLPVIAVSESDDGACRINPDTLARHVAGAAHIIHLSTEASWQLTRAIGKKMSVLNGAVRLYLPGLSEEIEDPYQHPLWLLQDGGGSFVQSMAGRVLPFAFLGERGPGDFPRFAIVREVLARRALARKATIPEIDKTRDELEITKLELSEAAEERESWQSLAHEEQNKRLSAEAEIERLKAELSRLDFKAAVLQHRLDEKDGSNLVEIKENHPLGSYENLEDWAEETVGENIYIHPAAIKDCKKSGHDNMLSRIESALIVIRDYVVPFKIYGGLERRDLAREKLLELGMEDTPCFVDREEAKRTAGYSVHYDGRTEFLLDHIKYGNGYDNANQIRIYYFWDAVKRCFVIGKMPSHLRNNLTT